MHSARVYEITPGVNLSEGYVMHSARVHEITPGVNLSEGYVMHSAMSKPRKKNMLTIFTI